MTWETAATAAEMVRRFIEPLGLRGYALADFARRMGVNGQRPDNTLRDWAAGHCRVPAGLMRRALRDLEREMRQEGKRKRDA